MKTVIYPHETVRVGRKNGHARAAIVKEPNALDRAKGVKGGDANCQEQAHQCPTNIDSNAAPSRTSGGADTRGFWLIYFEDTDRTPELFTSEEASQAAFDSYSVNWNCHLFCQAQR